MSTTSTKGWEVVGLLIAALVLLGLAPLAMPESYRWLEHGTSESAGQGLEGAWVARLGFIAFGLAVLRLLVLRAGGWGPLPSVGHLAFGVAMFGVAAFPTRPWEEGAPYLATEDRLHSVFASIVGFGFIVGVVSVAVRRWLDHRQVVALDVVALGVSIGVPLAMSTGIWGLLQRLMFVTAAIWYGREAVAPPEGSERILAVTRIP